MMVGAVEERVVAVDGAPAVKKVLPIRFTFDERIEDGLTAKAALESLVGILSDPDKHLGCLDDAPSEPG